MQSFREALQRFLDQEVRHLGLLATDVIHAWEELRRRVDHKQLLEVIDEPWGRELIKALVRELRVARGRFAPYWRLFGAYIPQATRGRRAHKGLLRMEILVAHTPFLSFTEEVLWVVRRILRISYRKGLCGSEEVNPEPNKVEDALYPERMLRLIREYVSSLRIVSSSRNSVMRNVFMMRCISESYASQFLGIEEGELAYIMKLLDGRPLITLGNEVVYAYEEGGLGSLLVELNSRIWHGLIRLMHDIGYIPEDYDSLDLEQEYMLQMKQSLMRLGWRPPRVLLDFYRMLEKSDRRAWRGEYTVRVKHGRIISICNLIPRSSEDYARYRFMEYNAPFESFLRQLMPGIIYGVLDIKISIERGGLLVLKIRPRSISDLIDLSS